MPQNTAQPKVEPRIQKACEEAVRNWNPGLEGIDMIRVHKVWGDSYRVDTFTKRYEEGSTVPQYRIEVSYLLEEKDGTLVDKTAGGSNRRWPVS
jgi:hypothetical protein